jgi:hypothetical protein
MSIVVLGFKLCALDCYNGFSKTYSLQREAIIRITLLTKLSNKAMVRNSELMLGQNSVYNFVQCHNFVNYLTYY